MDKLEGASGKVPYGGTLRFVKAMLRQPANKAGPAPPYSEPLLNIPH